MSEEEALSRPVGWWLKEADARLNAAFDRALQGTGVDRRGWQVLNVLAGGSVREAELVESLVAFDEPEAVHGVIGELRARGWVEEAAGWLRLTPEGTREHEVLVPLVDGVRRRVRTALPRDEYVTLVRLLARLTDAL